ncbi:MAG: Gfo/Idh/MocA family oxidoreductase [Oceanicaulis sp.]|nr:Gfo/Idh/MocA family oxidoreductase [Oceanicaulis sp.]
MKALFIGFGSIARKHKIALENLVPSIQLFALRRKESLTIENGVVNIFGWENIPPDIDFILITNPTSEHALTLKRAIKLNKPIFLEKPPLHDLTQASELIALIKSSNILVYSAFNLRFHPVIDWFKKNIIIGEVLEVSAYCGSYLPNWRPNTDYSKSYSASARLGGGVHLDLIHELDYLTFLFGEPITVQKNLRKVSDLAIDSIDSASYWLNYHSFSASVRLNYFRKDAKRTIEIVEKDRTLFLDLINFSATNQNGEILFSAHREIQETYNKQMAFFLEAIRINKISMNDFESSIRTLKICLHED